MVDNCWTDNVPEFVEASNLPGYRHRPATDNRPQSNGVAKLSLRHILELKPDFVKLDMELIRGVHADPYKALIATKMIEIALELA